MTESNRRQKPALTETQVRQKVIAAKKIVVVTAAVAMPVAIFVLFRERQSLIRAFDSAFASYDELERAHEVLKDQYLNLTEGYLTLSEKVIDKILDNVPQTALADIVHDMA